MGINTVLRGTILIIYLFSMSCILVYSLFQLQLAVLYLKSRMKRKTGALQPEKLDEYPFVTIQLPVYNEL